MMRAVAYLGIASFMEWWDAAKPQASFLPFQNPHVMRLWEKTIGAASGARCFAVRLDDERGEPLLAVFLALRRAGLLGLGTLSFMDGDVIDYNAPILFGPSRSTVPSARQLWHIIRAAFPRHDFLALNKIPPAVKDAPNPLWDPEGPRHFSSGHAMSLPDNWDAVEREKGTHKHAKTIKRKLRLLAETGPVQFRTAETGVERAQFLDALFLQKRQRLAGTVATDLFAAPGVEAFYRGAAELTPGAGHLSALFVKDEIVAAAFGFIDRDRYQGVLTSFAGGEWARYSCGNILLEFLIRQAIADGRKMLDFGVGDEDYKMFWCDRHVPLHDNRQTASLGGRLYLGIRDTLMRR